MRLPADAGFRLLAPLIACGLSAALAGCGTLGGGDGFTPLKMAEAPNGPAADYPMVLGEPFTIDGAVYTPADTLNYDAVGYAGVDDGAGVTASHRTLPLPCYAEVTSLESGKTILVRIERRGPMTGGNLIALSSAAAAQLGVDASSPVRLRRVNPTEAERAELRAGRSVPERMETPKSLVEVLRRKLPAGGTVTLNAPAPNVRGTAASAPPAVVASTAAQTPMPPVPAQPPSPPVAVVPVVKTIAPPPAPASATTAKLVVQAAAFASRANADRAAKALGGFVTSAGRLFLVRTGPFASRGQADAALAKVRAAGYSDARVTTAG